jgi:hypothetical protein
VKAKALIEERPFAVVIAGVRHVARNEGEAREIARRELEAWQALGYRRTAKIYYRDGSLIAEVRS